MPAWTINNFVRTPLLLLGLIESAILFSSVYIAGIFVFGSVQGCEANIGPLLPRAITVAVIVIISLIAMGLYHFHQRANAKEILVRVVVATVISAVVLSSSFYLLPTISLPMNLAAGAMLVAMLAIMVVRFIFLRIVDENIFRHRTLIYGAGERSAAILDFRRRADRRGFRIVGTVPAPGDTLITDHSSLMTGTQNLLGIAQEKDADEIVIAMDDRRGNLPVRELLDCKLRGINVIDLVEFMERESGKIRIDLVNPGWLIFSPGFRVNAARSFIKRTMDISVAALALFLLWPVMLLVALAIKLGDGLRAPVLYRQSRVGLHGNTFDVLKFRSMRVDAEADGQAVWADKNDSRVTRVGGGLRKFRLDELPQIINVFKGEMSLVGPRPERPQFVEQLSESIPFYSERHTVKPGVTGWAQLRYAYGSSAEDAAEKLQYDLYYVKNQNLLLDLVICLQTVEVVLWGKGAR